MAGFSHQKLGSVVAVLGTRGGVGTTTVATNLAWYLANNETRRVALVDLDIFFGDAALALNVKVGGGLREVLENPTRIDELYLERTLVLSGKRLYVLAAEERLDIPVKFDPEALPTLFDPLRKQYHYVVVDVPRHSGSFIQQVMDAAGDSHHRNRPDRAFDPRHRTFAPFFRRAASESTQYRGA